MSKPRLILASSSPRRLEILTNIGYKPDIILNPEIDETPIKLKSGAKESPLAYVERVARAKGELFRDKYPDDYIISADTIAVLAKQKIIGKAITQEQARDILLSLSGRRHNVLTCVYIFAPNGVVRHRLVKTSVKFKRLQESEIQAYLALNKWQGKAGAYGLQEDCGAFVIEIHGSYSSVIGLPAYETKSLLQGLGYVRSTIQ